MDGCQIIVAVRRYQKGIFFFFMYLPQKEYKLNIGKELSVLFTDASQVHGSAFDAY